MLRIFKSISHFLDWLDSLEVAFFALLAGALLLVSPLWLMWRYAHTQRYGAAFFCFLLWASCAAVFVRDFRQSRFSWVSGALLVLWFGLTLTLGLALE